MMPADLKAARLELGLSAAKFARVVGIGDGRTVRRWESGESSIPGPVALIVKLLAIPQVRRRLLEGELVE